LLLSVTKDFDGKTGIINIPVEDVLFLEYDFLEKRVWAHTSGEQYYIPGTLIYWAEALRTGGYDFKKVDRNVVVQVPKITILDRMLKCAYFESTIRKDSKRITLSHTYFKELAACSKSDGCEIILLN
jgi:DNA-binding LytR/AlgR family response regulator